MDTRPQWPTFAPDDDPMAVLIGMSRHYGGNPAFVLAGGGNTSYKTASRLYVKASGHALETIDADGFVEMDREALDSLLAEDLGSDLDRREEEYKRRVLDARVDPDRGQVADQVDRQGRGRRLGVPPALDGDFSFHVSPLGPHMMTMKVNQRLKRYGSEPDERCHGRSVPEVLESLRRGQIGLLEHVVRVEAATHAALEPEIHNAPQALSAPGEELRQRGLIARPETSLQVVAFRRDLGHGIARSR